MPAASPTAVLQQAHRLHTTRPDRAIALLPYAPNDCSLRGALVHQPLPLLGKLVFRPSCRSADMPPACLGRHGEEEIAGPPALVCWGRALWLPRLNGQRRLDLGQQLPTRLINIPLGPFGSIRISVHGQDVFPGGHKGATHVRQLPLLLPPWLAHVFFRPRRTVSAEQVSATPRGTTRSARSRSVQRWRPVGAERHASAINRAAPVSSSTGFCPGRGRSVRVSTRAVAHRLRGRSTVGTLGSTAAALSSSLRPLAALSSMRTRVSMRVGCWPRRSSCSRLRRSSSVNATWYFLQACSVFLREKGMTRLSPD
jgi:hypothetical protein